MVEAHTPGPWGWREGVLYPGGHSPNLHSIINDSGCSVHRNRPIEVWTAEADANRALLAAAPDLLEALRLAHEEIHHPGAARSEGKDIDAIVRAALTKAYA